MSIEFGLDRAGRPIVRKYVGLALGTHIADALVRKQAEILESARHPGVVEFRGIEPNPGPHGEPRLALLIAPVDGLPINKAVLTTGEIAGALAAVASIVADLHAQGIIHGALVADHILLEGGQRPKLCGFGSARLDRQSRSAGPSPIASVTVNLATAHDDVFALAMLGHELSARADNSTVRVGPPPAAASRRLLLAPADRSLQRTLAKVLTGSSRHRITARDLANALARCPGARLPRGHEVDHPSAIPTGQGLGPDPFFDQEPSLGEAEPSPQTRPASALAARSDSSRLASHSTDSDTDSTDPGIEPDSGPTQSRHPRFRRSSALASVASVLALGMAAATLWHRTRGGSAAANSRQGARPTNSASRATRSNASAQRCPAVPGPVADLNGDGCGEAVTVTGATLGVGSVRFALGAAQDKAAVGDWDCDGWVTPVLLSRVTGSVYRYDRWPSEGQPEVGVSLGPIPHAVGIQSIRVSRTGLARPRPCDDLLITRDDGSTVVITARLEKS